MSPAKRKNSKLDAGSPSHKRSSSTTHHDAIVSSAWPALLELEPARPATLDRPAASPVYRPVYAKEGPPGLVQETLLDMFE